MRYLHTGLAYALLVFSAGVPASDTGTQSYPEDCFNDAVAQRDDLEPPLPGSDADLLRITDQDVQALLANIAAAEERRKANAPQR